MTLYVYVELKTALVSGSIRTVANWSGDSYTLVEAESGEFVLRLPPLVKEIRPNETLYEDQAIRVRT